MIKISYSGYRFPSEIIQHAIWLYMRFTLSFRDVEDLHFASLGRAFQADGRGFSPIEGGQEGGGSVS
jgi:hypothetical protein